MSADDAKLILQRLDQQDRQLSRIERHAEETNGRVKKLELWQARVQGIISVATLGSGKAFTVVAAVVTGVLVYVLTH